MTRATWLQVHAVVAIGLGLCALRAEGQAAVAIPEPLQPYRDWVLKDVPDRDCAKRGEELLCEWPGALTLDLDAGGGRFEQQVRVDHETLFALPGAAGRWPFDVRIDGKPAAVVDREQRPSVWLQPGAYRIEGRFGWAALPERLELAAGTAFVDLRVAGKLVPFPRRDEQGQLWLLAQGSASAEGEQLALSVSRKLEDGVPLIITTRIKLRVAGRAREVNLGRVLLAGTKPLSLASELPARLEEQGDLRVQVRAGTYQVEIKARTDAAPTALAFRSASATWPSSETWVWKANEALRQVELSGAPAVDPGRTELDSDWHGLPTYTIREGVALKLETTRRGEASPPPNRLTLNRELWLDLDGRGYTVRDQLQTELHQGFRLDLLAGELGHVSADGEDLLITKGPKGKGAGVELRKQSQMLSAEWRAPDRLASVPAVGWSEDVQSLSATLHLGPGYSVFATSGVDSVSQTWISDWDLFALFFVLLCSIAVSRLCGVRYLPLALATLVLCEQEADAPGVVWVVLLAAIGLLRVLPAGWFRNLIRGLFALAAVTLLLIAVPFVADQIRGAIYPQLGMQGHEPGFGDMFMLGARSAKDIRPMADMPEETMAADTVAEQVAPPAPAAPAPAQEQSARIKIEDGSVSKGRGEQESPEWLQSYGGALVQDPEATLQTGPGVPTWQWRVWNLSWSGPVDRTHEIELYLIPPGLNRALTALRVLLLAALIIVLLRSATPGRDKPGGSLQRPPAAPAPTPAVAASTGVALIALLCAATTARADFPDQAMLGELRAQLTKPAACHPYCMTIDELALAVDPRELVLTMTVHAQAPTSVALPGPAASWVPASVALDGRDAAPVALHGDGFLHVRVEPGVHVVVARGALPPTDTLTLAVADRPHRGRAQADGYKVDGIREDGQVEQALQLSRLLANDEGAPLETAALPPWLALERSFELGPTWIVHNKLVRVSPIGTPLRVQVPLLPGESIIDAAIEVSNDALQVSFGRDDAEVAWSSRLKIADQLKLVAAQGKPFSERWRIMCGPIWHCDMQGLAPVGRGDPQRFEPEFAPWPGEQLTLLVGRPEPAQGQFVTIDAVGMRVTPGVRMRAAELTLQLRASRGGSEVIELPTGARVQSQTIDGENRPIRHEGDKLHFTVEPGTHNVAIHWQEPQGMATVEAPRPVTLHRPASNVRLSIELPEDRWLLWASGPSWGPAILFWGYLVFVVLVALALGRLRKTPLRTHEWFLLGLGLTQIPAPAALTVVGFLFAMQARASMGERTRLVHNLTQIGLVLLTLSALGCLFAAVHTGLLMRPEMQVSGAGSHGNQLHWYVDHVTGKLPTASVVSVPLWVFRLLMLLWSLWLARSLVRWLPWAFRCFKAGGLWRKGPPRTGPRYKSLEEPPAPAAPAPPDAG